ncbi:MAG: hypothetical protein WEB00_09610 [Dehalococcoidia bacterium]
MKLQTLLLAAIFALVLAATATAAEAPMRGETAASEAAVSAAPAGVARAWGDDSAGELGDGGANANQTTPVDVSSLTTVTAIDGGGNHSLALLSDGSVRAWGSDDSGQLGNSAAFSDGSTTPVTVSGLATVIAIAAGTNHSLALLSDGTVRAWGSDGSGQLGDGGTNTNQPAPITVSGLATVTAIAAGGAFSLALLDDGTVRAWGNDGFGQLGDGGTNTNQPSPVTVSGLATVTAIAAGSGFSLALLDDGTVRAWGSDNSGQLGDGGTNTNQPTPVAVSSLTTVTAIAAGGIHSLALLDDDTVHAWGLDTSGQLGDGGTNTNQPTPVAVSSLTTVTAIAGGVNHSLALLSDGSVRAWGFDGSGQLGNSAAFDDGSATPVAVSGLSGVAAIAAGNSHSLAVIPVCRGELATIAGTAAGETLTGTSGVDVIVGGGGNDTINGLGGDDVICGGDGRDTITGGPGDDIIDGGAGSDTGSFPGASVNVNLPAGTATVAGDIDDLTSIENARGSNSADTLIGNGAGNKLEGLGGNDLLMGGGGNDNLLGGAGNDTLEGGNGADALKGGTDTDTVSYPGASALTINLLDGSNNKGDTLSSIENVKGSSGNDSISGSNGPNRLEGLGGVDQLIGRAGADKLLGGGGNDTLNGGPDADTCDGGAGGGDVANSSCELTPNVP